jgi:hypothetical protein
MYVMPLSPRFRILMRICYARIVHDGASSAVVFFFRIWKALTTLIVIVLPGSAMFVLLYLFRLICHTDHDVRYFL